MTDFFLGLVMFFMIGIASVLLVVAVFAFQALIAALS